MEKINKGQIFYFFIFFYIGGIFLGNFFNLNFYFNIFLFSIGLAVIVSNYKDRKNIFIFFCLLGLLLGIIRIEKEEKKLNLIEEKEYSGFGLVINKPKNKDNYKQIEVCLFQEKKLKNCRQKALINISRHKDISFGDKLKINCDLKISKNLEERFNYRKFLANRKVYYLCEKTKIEKPQETGGLFLSRQIKIRVFVLKRLFYLSEIIENKINNIFNQPESGYLAGLLLGGEDRMPKETVENFRRTGTTHTVAVSGFNITIIAQFLIIFSIAIGFWRRQAFWLALLGITIFVLMIGAPASAVRAAIMAIILLWSINLGRLAQAYRGVVLAAAIMLIFSPFSLFYDAGFQLSFLATLGIIFIYSPLAEKFKIENDFLGLKSIILITVSAQLGVLGIIIYNFESFSFSSLIVNLIILPLIPIIMLFGFLTIIIGFFSLFLAKMFALPVWLMLFFEIKTVDFFAQFDFLIMNFKNVSSFWLAGYYLFLFLFIIYLRKKTRIKKE